MNDGSLPAGRMLQAGIGRLRAVLSGALSRFLGDTSYGVYLVHLLLAIPVAALLTRYPAYLAAPDWARWLVCLTLVVPPVYLIAWVLFRTVETGGIQLGKTVIRQLRARKNQQCRPMET